MKSLIVELSQIPAPSGHESRVRDVIAKEVKSLADSIRVDELGNLIVHRGKKSEDGKKIMISTHMDEIGVIATHIDASGFIRFSNLGSLPASTLAGSRVLFLNGVKGTIQPEPQNDGSKNLSPDQFFIDIGAAKPGDCPVKISDAAVFEAPVFEQAGKLIGKALSSRSGCALLIEVLRELKNTPHELDFVFTTQGEVGSRGVQGAAYALDPDLAISVEATDTGDTPSAAKMDVALGKGPAVKIRDTGMLSDPRVIRWITKTAEKEDIVVQKEISLRGTTDASQIQTNRAGVPTGVISLPCRYIHSLSEMIHLDDLEKAKELLLALLQDPVKL